MGRTDEVQFLLECVKAWQSRGARVTFQSGWETRGNGLQGNYEGCIIHHTAFVSSAAKPNPALSTLINGRPDLSGPLCNATAPWSDSPWLHVIAAYPANHAGASGGRSMGPLPVTSLFNPRVLGLEIDYSGVAPMNPGQYRAGLIFARGVSDVLGRSTEFARGHAETSITGKWDPGFALGKTIDMAAFRRDAASVTGAEDLDANQAQQLDYVYTVLKGGNPSMDVLSVLYHALLDPLSSATHHGNDDDNPLGHAVSAHKYAKQVVDALAKGAGTAAAAQPAVNVDAAAVAKALAGNAAFVDAIATASADKIAARLQS